MTTQHPSCIVNPAARWAWLPALLGVSMAMAAEPPKATIVDCGQLFDPERAQLVGPASLTIRDGRIEAVNRGTASRGSGDAGLPRIDLSDRTCLPGLIDMHVHLSGETSREAYSEGFRLNPEDFALRSVGHARKTLEAGFTSVRDLGGAVAVPLRNAIDQGYVAGPRIHAAGKSIATTGGHADPANGYNREIARALGYPGPEEGVVSGKDEARKAVRQRYKDGSDVIKITATGGVLSFAKNGQNPQFTVDEISEIVATAHDYGFKVAAHAHGDEGMRRAVEAGVDSIEHGTFMSADTMALMKAKGTWYVPTISAGVFVGEKAREPGYYPAIVVPKALTVGPQISKTFAAAYKAGVRIAFGTDAAVFPHGQNRREFRLMVDAGMPPAETLVAATKSAAILLNDWANVGSLDVGKYADIVAVHGDPTRDIDAMETLDFVMKGGEVVVGSAPAP